METHAVNQAVDIYEDLPSGKLSRIPIARIVFLGFDNNFTEEMKGLTKIFSRNTALQCDVEALKENFVAIWLDRMTIDNAVSVSLIDFKDDFQSKWFGGSANKPWILPRPENVDVEGLRKWMHNLDYITERVCKVTQKTRDQFLT